MTEKIVSPGSDLLPSFDELPVSADAPPASSWGLWGPNDVLGTLNLINPEATLRGLSSVTRGITFALNASLDQFDPPLAGRPSIKHEVRWLARDLGHDDELSRWNPQNSSQWDGFRHIRHLSYGFYNGVPDEDHGVHHWARRGIATRAVIADVARWRAKEGRTLRMDATDPIEPEDLMATLEAQGSTVEVGDILLVRTGWLGWYRSLEYERRAELAQQYQAPGLRACTEMAALLWDLHIAAVAADNSSLEAWPPAAMASDEQRRALRTNPSVSMAISLHFDLLPLLGIPIGEMWDLDALAEDCSSEGTYYAFLTSAPLNLPGGVASPSNALAIR